MNISSQAFSRQLFGEGVWIAFGHGIAGIATLAGVRFITEFAEPSLYGTFVLVNGGLSLLDGLALQPFAQAALRYYPEYFSIGASDALKRQLVLRFSRRWFWGVIGFMIIAVIDALTFHFLSIPAWFMLALLFGLDGCYTAEIVMRNAARQQAAYAVLFALNSIARPLGAALGVWVFSASLEILLIGQAVGAIVVLAITTRFSWYKSIYITANKFPESRIYDLELGMKRFASPLVWAPLVAWAGGIADRYIVGGTLSLAQAGIYAAAYGLACRPLLMVGTVTEATLRQVLYAAVARNDARRVRTTLVSWAGINGVAGAIIMLLLWLARDFIVGLLLGFEYRGPAANLLPWIGLGYLIILSNQVAERLLYAYQRTRLVTLIQVATAALAIIGAYIGARFFGLLGVAIAVPVYAFLKLVLTATVVLRASQTKLKES
jgi:O-antigen/teichoic acid export membrane protein